MAGFRIQDSGFRAELTPPITAASSSSVNPQFATAEAKAAAKADYNTKRDKLHKTTQEFEAVFIGMMLKNMRKSMTSKNALFGSSPEAKMYQDMMDDATAQQMSKVGTFGLAKVLYKTMEHSLPPKPETPDAST